MSFRSAFHHHLIFTVFVSIDTALFTVPPLFDEAPQQSCAVNAERGLEVGNFMEVMFEALAKCMAVGTVEISLHLGLADHAVLVSVQYAE